MMNTACTICQELPPQKEEKKYQVPHKDSTSSFYYGLDQLRSTKERQKYQVPAATEDAE